MQHHLPFLNISNVSCRYTHHELTLFVDLNAKFPRRARKAVLTVDELKLCCKWASGANWTDGAWKIFADALVSVSNGFPGATYEKLDLFEPVLRWLDRSITRSPDRLLNRSIYERRYEQRTWSILELWATNLGSFAPMSDDRPSSTWTYECGTWYILDIWAANLTNLGPMSGELERRGFIFGDMSDELD